MTCGRRDDEVGAISWRGNCFTCGMERVEQAAMEMHNKRGPTYRRWQQRLVASVAGIPLDAVRSSSNTH